jgi:hypothetical protein
MITASTWGAVFSSAWDRALKRNGFETGSEGTIAPRVTNAEAVQMIRAWRIAVGGARFPLWYQFAAVAYGWDPPDNDTLDAQDPDAWYPTDVNVALWVELHRVSLASDDIAPVRLDVDDLGGYTDPGFMLSIRDALAGDGASAQFKIPLPACKDPKTGKPVGRPHRDPKTGKWRCDPVTIDDPITYIGKSFASTLLILGLVWFLASDNKPRRRRRT